VRALPPLPEPPRQSAFYRGTWKSAHFKKYNFEAEGIYPNGGALHPLLKVREEMRNIFLEMGLVTTQLCDTLPN
jgi:phenylalanyl-tRNA synthetase alpha subunit